MPMRLLISVGSCTIHHQSVRRYAVVIGQSACIAMTIDTLNVIALFCSRLYNKNQMASERNELSLARNNKGTTEKAFLM